jgi:DNA-binding NarL/FixJ family response regulator
MARESPGGRWKLRISPRQAGILSLAAEGHSDKEVAQQVRISTATVRTHLERFYRDNKGRNRAQAVALFIGGRGRRE